MKRFLQLFGLLIITTVILTVALAEDYSDIETQNKEVVTRLIEEVWNQDVENYEALKPIASELFASIFTSHSPASLDKPIKTLPTAWLANKYLKIREAFPGLHITIETMFVEDDFVVVHYTAQGTFENYIYRVFFDRYGGDIQPSGEVETWDGIFMFRLEDGKIIEEYWYFDRTWLGIMHRSLNPEQYN